MPIAVLSPTSFSSRLSEVALWRLAPFPCRRCRFAFCGRGRGRRLWQLGVFGGDHQPEREAHGVAIGGEAVALFDAGDRGFIRIAQVVGSS